MRAHHQLRRVAVLRHWVLLGVGATMVAGCVAGCQGPDHLPPGLSPPSPDSTQAPSPAPAAPPPTVLILDASGSMTTSDAPGPRIDAAKRAAKTLVDGLPDSAQLGLVTYGIGTGSSEAEMAAGCEDVHTLIPLGRVDSAATDAQIDLLTPSGYTPIALALTTAAGLLPTDGSPQAIVLVSDGEDTCGQPPCDVAQRLRQTHPGLSISTVGFRTDGPASEQLACIASGTGGIFVQADNADQLAARLVAVQNVDVAKKSLTNNGIDDLRLGQGFDDIRKAHPDFPDVGRTGKVAVVYVDCDFGFVDGALDSIAPHDGGRTIDGVTAGTDMARVTELYCDPVSVEPDQHEVIYRADPGNEGSTAAYRIDVDQFTQNGGRVTGSVKTIVLCRCRPQPQAEQVVAVSPMDYDLVEGGNSYGLFFMDPTGKWWCHIDQGDVKCFRGGAGDALLATLGIADEPLATDPYSTDGQPYPPNVIGIFRGSSGQPVAKFAFYAPSTDAARSELRGEYEQTKTLDYDRSITGGGYTCVVRRSGISCDGAEGDTVGHGFTFSDSGYTLR